MEYKTTRYNEEDKKELFEFFKLAWPQEPIHQNEGHWRWRFLENPNNPKGGAPIFLFKEDHRILGHWAGLSVRLKVGHSEYFSAWAVDLMTLPQFRDKGIGYYLMKEFSRAVDVSLGLGISDMALALFEKANWFYLGTIPLFAKVITFSWVGKNGDLKKSFLSSISFLIGLFLEWRSSIFSKRVSIKEISTFDHRFDELWNRVKKSYPVIVRRDQTYLNWRYSSRPFVDYIILEAERPGQLTGFIILRIKQQNDKRVGYFIDFLTAPTDISTIRQLFLKGIKIFREEGVEIAYCLTTNRIFQRALKWMGFVPRPSTTRLMSYPNKAGIDSNLLKVKENYFVTYGDSDEDS